MEHLSGGMFACQSGKWGDTVRGKVVHHPEAGELLSKNIWNDKEDQEVEPRNPEG